MDSFTSTLPTCTTGALAPKGSISMPYNCTCQYEYYDLGVYNSLGKQLESTQVVNPKY
jgi:hypothetical protein